MQRLNQISVTEQTIDISNLTEQHWVYYQNLANKITSLYQERGRGRQIFSLSGPPGSGKSVITAILNSLLEDSSSFNFVNIGLDAFHYHNDYLIEKNLKKCKGRFDTYDTELLTAKLQDFKNNLSISFPVYSRKLHNPVPDSISITNTNTLILLEGQWLLRNTTEWSAIKDLCSYNFILTGNEKDLRTNVIKRHIAGGRGKVEAELYYEQSGKVNSIEIQKNSVEADEEILFYRDI